MQERCNSIALAMELHLSCTNPMILELSQSTISQINMSGGPFTAYGIRYLGYYWFRWWCQAITWNSIQLASGRFWWHSFQGNIFLILKISILSSVWNLTFENTATSPSGYWVNEMNPSRTHNIRNNTQVFCSTDSYQVTSDVVFD